MRCTGAGCVGQGKVRPVGLFSLGQKPLEGCEQGQDRVRLYLERFSASDGDQVGDRFKPTQDDILD